LTATQNLASGKGVISTMATKKKAAKKKVAKKKKK
jgi:hypothetical protein